MIHSVRDACEIHDHVRHADPGPEIDDLIDALAAAVSSSESAAQFFRTNHVIGGTRLLLELGFRRLAEKGEQPSLVLSQAMGGGKTHVMIAAERGDSSWINEVDCLDPSVISGRRLCVVQKYHRFRYRTAGVFSAMIIDGNPQERRSAIDVLGRSSKGPLRSPGATEGPRRQGA